MFFNDLAEQVTELICLDISGVNLALNFKRFFKYLYKITN